MHEKLVSKMEDIEELANNSDLNFIFNSFENIDSENIKPKSKYGIISSGSAFNYAYDVVVEDNLANLGFDILKLGFTYPFPKDLALDFIEGLDGIFVVEEVDPIMEKEILAIIGEIGIDIPVFGKLDGTFPLIHEFNSDIVRDSINKVINSSINTIDNINNCNNCNNSNNINNSNNNINNCNNSNKINNSNNNSSNYNNSNKINNSNNGNNDLNINKRLKDIKDNLPSRPPTLCPGCSHRATYFGVRRAAEELNISNENLIFFFRYWLLYSWCKSSL